MSDVKEYIKGDKHVHQAGSVMIKFAQYNVPGQKATGNGRKKRRPRNWRRSLPTLKRWWMRQRLNQRSGLR